MSPNSKIRSMINTACFCRSMVLWSTSQKSSGLNVMTPFLCSILRASIALFRGMSWFSHGDLEDAYRTDGVTFKVRYHALFLQDSVRSLCVRPTRRRSLFSGRVRRQTRPADQETNDH